MEISGLDGDPEVSLVIIAVWAQSLTAEQHQLVTVRSLHSNVVPLQLELQRIARLSQDCEEANIEENDHTVHSYDDLEYEYGLAKESVTKKLGFLENQVASKDIYNPIWTDSIRLLPAT